MSRASRALEQGRRFRREDFPKSNWDLRRFLWVPRLNWRGLFKMSFLPHVTVLSGVGVGGGSLVYANTLPTPKDDFFAAPSWGGLADWKAELEEHYATARRMLGSTPCPFTTEPDRVLAEVAADLGKSADFHRTEVAVYFGQPGKAVADPYFGGQGPARTGCTACGGCMLGCRVGAKNTLDQFRLSAQAGYWLNGVMPYVSLAYTDDVGRKTTQFGVSGNPIGRDAFVLGAGLNFYSMKDGVTGGVGYRQEFGRNNQTNYSLMANINLRF